MHFARALLRLSGYAAAPARRRRAMRAALAAMVVINVALAAGALYPLAAARFEAVGGAPGLEAVAVALSLTAALSMTALVTRARK